MAERMHRGLLACAVIVGAFSIASLVCDYLFDFGVSAAICAVLVIAAHFYAVLAEDHREQMARERNTVWDRRELECREEWSTDELDEDEWAGVWDWSTGAPE